MQFSKIMEKRKSTYDFSEKIILKEDLYKILEAARLSPSFSNMQPWKIMIVKEKSKIKKLIDFCYYGSFHTSPNLILVLILDPSIVSKKDYRGSKKSKMGKTNNLLNN